MNHFKNGQIPSEVLEALGLGVMITDRHGQVFYINQQLMTLWQIPSTEWVKKKGGWPVEALLVQLSDPSVFIEWMNNIDLHESHALDALFFKDGRVLTGLVGSYTHEGKSQGLVWTFRDISIQKQLEHDLLRRIQTDAITALPNAVTLKDRLQQSVLLAQRHHHGLVVIVLQIKNFDLICDLSGRAIGEEILKIIAGRLLKKVRHSDIVAQLANNKFCIVLQEISNEMDTWRMIREIETIASEPIAVNDNIQRIKVNIGMSFFPDDGEKLLSRADMALHNLSEYATQISQVYEQSIHDTFAKRSFLEQALHLAIEKKQLMIYYQPVVAAKTKKIIGAEALLRWYHPQHGLISPAEFIPIAERTGDIVPISEWIFDRICMHSAAWVHPSIKFPTVAFNLSAQQLKKDNFMGFLKIILNKYKLTEQDICIELTEGIFVDDDIAKEKLIALKVSGFKLSLDDFGTGYSNLGYLSEIAFNHIKIDKSFISKIVSSEVDAALVQSIISMAHNLNMTTIAEGVETEEEFEKLKEYQCDYIQGYFFSKPLPYDEFKAWVIDNQT